MNHMMIDLETVDTGNDAGIIQVGVAVFDPYGDRMITTKQWNVNLMDSLLCGGTVSKDTIEWWRTKTTDQARYSVTTGGSTNRISSVLHMLGEVYNQHGCGRVWSHGLTFDIAILNGYYTRAGKEPPWRYTAARDTRTRFEDAAEMGWSKPDRGPTAHTAEADAVAQAMDIQDSTLFMFRNGQWQKKHATAVGLATLTTAEVDAILKPDDPKAV